MCVVFMSLTVQGSSVVEWDKRITVVGGSGGGGGVAGGIWGGEGETLVMGVGREV